MQYESCHVLVQLPNKMQQRQDLIVDLMLRDMHLEDARRHGALSLATQMR